MIWRRRPPFLFSPVLGVLLLSGFFALHLPAAADWAVIGWSVTVVGSIFADGFESGDISAWSSSVP